MRDYYYDYWDSPPSKPKPTTEERLKKLEADAHTLQMYCEALEERIKELENTP